MRKLLTLLVIVCLSSSIKVFSCDLYHNLTFNNEGIATVRIRARLLEWHMDKYLNDHSPQADLIREMTKNSPTTSLVILYNDKEYHLTRDHSISPTKYNSLPSGAIIFITIKFYERLTDTDCRGNNVPYGVITDLDYDGIFKNTVRECDCAD